MWIPQEMSREASMPFCPTCKRNTHVKSYGFNSNHIGRLIIGLKQNYYIITQRYKCLSCEARKKELQNELQRNDPQTKEKVTLKFTFMGWDRDSLPVGNGVGRVGCQRTLAHYANHSQEAYQLGLPQCWVPVDGRWTDRDPRGPPILGWTQTWY